MNALRYLLAITLLVVFAGCEGVTVDVGMPGELPPPAGKPGPSSGPNTGPGHHDPYGHMPRRTSYSPMSSVQLKEGCYVGDFVLGRSQIDVAGAGIDRTVIDGNLVLKTQCEVSNLTVTGDVIFEGHQAKLIDVDFYGRIIDKGMQNNY
jgi:hypothetical protein